MSSGIDQTIAKCKLQNANCKLPRANILHFAICILHFAILIPTHAQDTAAESLAAREETALRAAAESVAESVVQIRTIGGLDTSAGTPLPDGPTTGLVISPDGYIISSSLNFVQQPASILVTLPTGKQAPAELVATDHSRMLVLLKVAGVADLAVPPMAPADEIRPGQWAIAVGRTFRADRTNVAVGIVSAVGRMFGKVIQTDAGISTANYGGPLVDIRGRVLGVIVPMAPQGASDVAGVELYDSGIGFAVPLAPLAERLELMKQGQDQRTGILGIGLLRKNPHAAPAELAAVRPDAPAGQAGLRKGDRIIEIDGRPIHTQTDLRFALGPRYGGESVRIVAKRGDERLERMITLVGELPAFRHAFLGVLPMRQSTTPDDERAGSSTSPAAEATGAEAGTRHTVLPDAGSPARDESLDNGAEGGVVVRTVYEASPAAEAGIQAGDRIVRINETDINSIENAIETLNNVAPGNEVKLQLVRSDGRVDLALTATRMPTSVPSELPPAYTAINVEAGGSVAAARGEISELQLPEFPHQCKVFVPASHAEGGPQAALLWLHAPADVNPDEVIRQWQAICDRDGVLLIVPTVAENDRWERTELEYLRRLIDRVIAQYKIDPHRVVVGGHEGGGAMAWLLALTKRDVIRGVATSAAPLPRRVRVPPNEPTQRLAVFAATPPNKDAAAQFAEGLRQLSEAGYSVTTVTASGESGKLSDAQRAELARWIDTLDRF